MHACVYRGRFGADWPPTGQIPAERGSSAGDPVPARRRRAAGSGHAGFYGDPWRPHRAGTGKKRSTAATRSSTLPVMAIFTDRWNAEVKRKIRDSRVHSAENLVDGDQKRPARPKVFVQGSAIGFYGPHGDEELTESSPSGNDFLAVVCRECEDVSRSIESLGVRRAIVRTGIVLAPGAALSRS